MSPEASLLEKESKEKKKLPNLFYQKKKISLQIL